MTPRARHLLSFLVAAVLAVGLVNPSGAAYSQSSGSTTRTVVRGVDIDAATIPQLQRLMNRHRLSSAQLVRFYIRRIHRLNPKLHAVITVDRTAPATARRADRLRRHGDRRPLLGIPVLVKDNVDTTGMATTAGSLALARSKPRNA